MYDAALAQHLIVAVVGYRLSTVDREPSGVRIFCDIWLLRHGTREFGETTVADGCPYLVTGWWGGREHCVVRACSGAGRAGTAVWVLADALTQGADDAKL